MSLLPLAENLADPQGARALIGGRYKLLTRLGAGGGGAVYEAIDTVTDRLRAIKLIDDGLGDEALHRFERETKIASRVESPSLVEIVDCGHDRAHHALYLVMERLRGADFGKVLREEGRLSPAAAANVLEQVAQGLRGLHDEGIVHRDVKPENVFRIATEGSGNARVKLLDLGLAKQFQVTSPKTTRALGTPAFMAPEQLRGDATVDHRADLYGYAQLAYTLLVGKAYYARELASATNLYALLLSVAEGPREPASARAAIEGAAVPAGFDTWFRRATATDPAARFSTIEEAHAALASILGGAPPALADLVPRKSPRRDVWIGVAVSLVAALAALVIRTLGAAPHPATEAAKPVVVARDDVSPSLAAPLPAFPTPRAEDAPRAAPAPPRAPAEPKAGAPSAAKPAAAKAGPKPESASKRDPLDSL